MSAWQEAYEKLDAEQKARVKRWIHLQQLIARTLNIPFEKWIETYVGDAMAAPFDYTFMEVTVPGFAGLDVEGASFSHDVDPSTTRIARVPLKAKNQMGRLSPPFQEALAGLLEARETGPVKVPPADVATLQKVLASAKPLARLKRKDFRRVQVRREDNILVIELAGDSEVLLQQDLFELSAVLKRPQL